MSKSIEILLVEDSLTDRFLALEALAEAKVVNTVHAVQDGVEALDFVRRTGKFLHAPKPDLILLDLNLPRKDGRNVLAELKTEPELGKIPVVILATAGDANADGWQSYPEHAQSFITKPIDVKQFDEIIRIFQDLWFPNGTELRINGHGTESKSPPPADPLENSLIPARFNGEPVQKVCSLSSALGVDPEEALVIFDDQSNILWVNEAFTRTSGYNSQEVVGLKAESLLQGPKTDQAAIVRMKLAVAGNRACTEEIVNYHKDGHPYWIRLAINPLAGPEGEVRRFLAIEKLVSKKTVSKF
jgi:chemotaxis family two-component system response regulator Rcp1